VWRLREWIVSFALAGVTVTAMGAYAHALASRAPKTPPPERPRADPASPYVSSSACVSCHPAEHASFARTFHRTMTQDATPKTVLAPFERRGDEVFADGRRVVLTTGSHRQQAYWVAGDRAGDLQIAPWVWIVRDAKLIPRSEAFLTPPGAPLPRVRWSSSCIACHAVAGEPRHDPARDAFDTRAAELGVACEACHGPGSAHVARHRDPVERWAQHRSKRPDPTIVHPKKLAPDRAAAVCGQCHAYAFPRDEDEWWTRGYSKSFRAGDPLERSRFLLGTDTTDVRIEASVESLFWRDGTIRVGGREYNGLVLSPCFTKGDGARKMTCLSCHTMHEGDPRGQIAPSRSGDAACTSCHASSVDHSHHAAGSPGRACVACHMPKTSYALLSAVRSHRIESPSAASTLATGKPNACNLCHLDRSLAWTADRLREWFGAAPLEAPGERAQLPEGAYGALSGDAAVRVLVADALGSAEAPVAAPFRAQLLRELRADPYAAVRFVASRSSATVHDVDAPGPLDPALVRALLAARDGRAITIAE
jgi:predicted CXXCH cytochrome family protein